MIRYDDVKQQSNAHLEDQCGYAIEVANHQPARVSLHCWCMEVRHLSIGDDGGVLHFICNGAQARPQHKDHLWLQAAAAADVAHSCLDLLVL